MIGFDFKITNKAGEYFIFNEGSQAGAHVDPLGVFALQKYPQFTKSIKNNEIARTGQVGVWDFNSYYGRLSITFQGIIVAETHQEAEQMKAKMQRVFALPAQPTATNDGYITIEWTDDDGVSKIVEAKLSQDISFDRRLGDRTTIDFSINLKTKTPYIYSGAVGGGMLSEQGVRGYSSYGGIFMPTLAPISWNGSLQNVLQIDNTASGVDSPTVIRLYGEAQQVITNPKITSLTTGTVMQVAVTLADENDYIELDGINGTIKNSAGIDISGSVTAGSQFITLIVGLNDLLYTSDQNPYITLLQPTAIFNIDYYQTYES